MTSNTALHGTDHGKSTLRCGLRRLACLRTPSTAAIDQCCRKAVRPCSLRPFRPLREPSCWLGVW